MMLVYCPSESAVRNRDYLHKIIIAHPLLKCRSDTAGAMLFISRNA